MIGRFGSFLFNCSQERQQHALVLNTPSLWGHLHHLQLPKRSLSAQTFCDAAKPTSQKSKSIKTYCPAFINPYYDSQNSRTLIPAVYFLVKFLLTSKVDAQSIQLWTNYYFRLLPDLSPANATIPPGNSYQLKQGFDMRLRINELERLVAELRSQATKQDELSIDPVNVVHVDDGGGEWVCM